MDTRYLIGCAKQSKVKAPAKNNCSEMRDRQEERREEEARGDMFSRFSSPFVTQTGSCAAEFVWCNLYCTLHRHGILAYSCVAINDDEIIRIN